MRRSISSKAKSFLHRNLLYSGNSGTSPSSSFSICGFCFSRRAYSNGSDYREML